MGMSHKTTLSIGIVLTITAFSCSLPFFKGSSMMSAERTPRAKSARLSGILQLQEGCGKGYYQVKLQGILDNSNIQVESQTDSSGRFNLLAPAGAYMMLVTKENCGSRETVELSENTEHMLSVSIREIKSVEKLEKNWGRIPASILVLPKK